MVLGTNNEKTFFYVKSLGISWHVFTDLQKHILLRKTLFMKHEKIHFSKQFSQNETLVGIKFQKIVKMA